MTDDPLVNADGSIDWPDVAERAYKTVAQAIAGAVATMTGVQAADGAGVLDVDLSNVEMVAIAGGFAIATGLASLANNTVLQWLAAQKAKSLRGR